MERQLLTALALCSRCRRHALALRHPRKSIIYAVPPAQSNPHSRGIFSSTKDQSSAIDEPRDVTLARQHCEKLLEKHDYPSSLIRRLIPAYARDAFTAIRAFNIDVAQVADQTSNAALGNLRMKWWSDAIDKLFDGGVSATGPPTNQPVTLLLRHAVRNTRLSKGFFKKVITAREQCLGNPPFASLSSLETYAENTYSSLYYLTLEALQFPTQNPSVELDHVASHAGKASGIAAVLRGTPILAFPPTDSPSSSAAVVLPLDISTKHNLRQEDVLRYGGKADGLKDVVFEIATRANDHLITAQTMYSSVGKGMNESVFSGFLPAVAAALYLKRLEKVDFDVFHPSMLRREWKLPWYLYKATKNKEIVSVR